MVLALRARGLFDGIGPGLVDQPVIVLDGGRVRSVTAGGEPPKDAELVDLGDVTVLPGLVDTHVHLAFDGRADQVGRLRDLSDEELFGWMQQAARQTLASGVTTVRDLGDRGYLALRLREQLRTDPAGGPHIVASGPPITTRRGHCWFLGGEADGVDQVRSAVRERAARGVDVIKLMASGGEITPGSAGHLVQYGPAELVAAADEAHRHGLPITAHAHAPESIAQVVAAGFDMIEHCSFITEHGIGADPVVIDAIARSPVVVSLTLGSAPGAPPLTPRIASRFDEFVAALQALRRAGVDVVCGSDSGIVNKPHGLLPYGAAMMVQVGYTPLEALRAVTSAAAHACGVGHRKGRIAPGLDADFLAVAGNPLTDISALLDVVAVFRAGARFTASDP